MLLRFDREAIELESERVWWWLLFVLSLHDGCGLIMFVGNFLVCFWLNADCSVVSNLPVSRNTCMHLINVPEVHTFLGFPWLRQSSRNNVCTFWGLRSSDM